MFRVKRIAHCLELSSQAAARQAAKATWKLAMLKKTTSLQTLHP